MIDVKTGFADVNGAKLYYELAGKGQPFVMIHAGIADHRMWNNEFDHFSQQYQVLRYDMRGYGKSVPVEGEFNIQDDLVTLLNILKIEPPIILMGCSIGAGLAIDFTLTHPEQVKALISVGGAPTGLQLDAPDAYADLFEKAEQAIKEKNIDLATEIDMQIWFDGMGRTRDDVNTEARQLAYDMNRIAIENDVKQIGKHIRKQFDKPAAERLDELNQPVLIVIGTNDEPYLLLAAEYMEEHLSNATKVLIPDAAHLPNLEHPQIFGQAVEDFLNQVKIV